MIWCINPLVGWESLVGARLQTTQYPCKIDCLSILRHCLTLRSIGNIITEVMAAPNGCCSEVVEIWSRTRKSMILSQKSVRPSQKTVRPGSQTAYRRNAVGKLFRRDEKRFCNSVKKTISLDDSLCRDILVFLIFRFFSTKIMIF